MNDLYSVLGVSRDASSQAIKLAFRELAKEHHPDLHLGDWAAENRTKEINHAYTVLSDLDRRAAYDAQLQAAAARKRKTVFVNAVAIAAGFVALAVVGASATLVASSVRPPVEPQQRYALIGVPERAAGRYVAADFAGESETAMKKQPAVAAQRETVQEPEQAALVLIAPLKAAAKAKLAPDLARHNAPSRTAARRAARRSGFHRIAIAAGGFASQRDLEAAPETAPWFIGR
jgi:curved DNA-binding protein CbpA